MNTRSSKVERTVSINLQPFLVKRTGEIVIPLRHIWLRSYAILNSIFYGEPERNAVTYTRKIIVPQMNT